MATVTASDELESLRGQLAASGTVVKVLLATLAARDEANERVLLRVFDILQENDSTGDTDDEYVKAYRDSLEAYRKFLASAG